MNICIVGTGYVGLSTGTCLAYLGHQVRGFDVDKQRTASLRKGVLPIYEPGLQELFNLARNNLTFGSDPALAMRDADVIFITVGTPSLRDGRPDLQYIDSAAETVGKHLTPSDTVIVNKSTIPIGTNSRVAEIVRKTYRKSRPGPEERFAVAYNPEFLRQGSAIQDTLYPDRIVLGSDSVPALQKLKALYGSIIDQTFEAPEFLPRPKGLRSIPVVTTDLASAEIIKYAANAFLALKISFANELAQLTERVNADISQVIHGMGTDRRIGHQFLQAGLGWGGSCFGKDTAALVTMGQQHGLHMRITRAARDVNYSQRESVVVKLTRELHTLEGKVVGLLGLAFKPHTDDVRDAPALDIARRLVARGATVRAHDPAPSRQALLECQRSRIQFCESVHTLAEGAHALVLVTEWPQYQTLPWARLASGMFNPLILDGRNALDRESLEQAGFRYVGMGRPDRPTIRPLTSVPSTRRNPTAAGAMEFGRLISFDPLLNQTCPVPG